MSKRVSRACKWCGHKVTFDVEKHDKHIYNKALDDFAKALTTMYERYDIDDVFESSDTYSYTSACYIFEHYIDEIAEQLKAGVENENYNKEES